MEYRLKLERIVVDLRWVAAILVLGQAIYVADWGVPELWVLLPLALLISYNTASYAVLHHLRVTPGLVWGIAVVSSVLDLAMVTALVVHPDFLPDVYLGYVFVIVAVALRLELAGAVVAAVVAALVYWGISLPINALPQSNLEPTLGRSAFLLVLGVGMGLLAKRLEVERERRETMARLAQQRASELEAVIASIADGVTIADKTGRIVTTNEAGRKIFGFKDGDCCTYVVDTAATCRHRDLQGTPLGPRELPLSRALQGETVEDCELVVRGPDSQDTYLSISAAPVRTAEGEIVAAVSVFHDITSIRRQQVAKDELISVASHELRTPLTSVKGYAQLMLKKLPETQEMAYERHGLSIIDEQADRLTALVSELLDVSRAQTQRLRLQAETFDLVDLLKSVLERLAPALERNELSFGGDDRLPVSADRGRIEQVFTNLMSNAIKYSPEGSQIAVEVHRRGEEAMVMVRDQGIGIPEHKQALIFEQWYQAHKGYAFGSGGLGLGLYISHEIVSAHGGRIWVDSEEGKGSAFYFSLPLELAVVPLSDL
jgi:signal transduction histidine kinase